MAEWVPFGTVVKPHGVRGERKAICETDEPPIWRGLTSLRVTHPSRKPTVHKIENFKFAGGLLVLRLESITDRNEVDLLRGAELHALANELPPLSDDEYWLYELRGARAVGIDGQHYGTIKQVVTNTMQLLLEIDSEGQIKLVPFVEDFVVEFDREARCLKLDPPDGLL